MRPERHFCDANRFEEMRHSLDIALAFFDLMIDADGMLAGADRVGGRRNIVRGTDSKWLPEG
jgi:hypothetical protein